VHGGSWRRGRRQDFGPAFRERPDGSPGLFARLARDGFAVVSADYRLSGEAPFPAALDDLRSALRWLALRADELGVDPDRITVWGESAGGHLASLLALTAAEPPFPAAAIAWYGPAELAGPVRGFDPADPATPEALLLGAAPTEVPELAGAASPVARVHPDAPPFMLVHGTADSVVPVEHSELLADRLRAAGVAVELLLVPGAEHGWYGLPGDRVDELVAAALAFADAAGR
jgi:acetyl esterase/lipase